MTRPWRSVITETASCEILSRNDGSTGAPYGAESLVFLGCVSDGSRRGLRETFAGRFPFWSGAWHSRVHQRPASYLYTVHRFREAAELGVLNRTGCTANPRRIRRPSKASVGTALSCQQSTPVVRSNRSKAGIRWE